MQRKQQKESSPSWRRRGQGAETQALQSAWRLHRWRCALRLRVHILFPNIFITLLGMPTMWQALQSSLVTGSGSTRMVLCVCLGSLTVASLHVSPGTQYA